MQEAVAPVAEKEERALGELESYSVPAELQRSHRVFQDPPQTESTPSRPRVKEGEVGALE